MSVAGFIDELERDLGMRARLHVFMNVGGQRRYVPQPGAVEGSRLSKELGPEIACWLAGRFGGETVTFPSPRGTEAERQAAALRADVLDAGLTDPTISANDIAARHGVTERRVRQIRAELRAEQGAALDDTPPLLRLL